MTPSSTPDLIAPVPRSFLPADFTLNSWEDLEPYYDALEHRLLDSREALERWLHDVSELEAVVGEDAAWRQIRMTTDTTDKDYEQAFTTFVMDIEPKIKPRAFALNQKLLACPYTRELDPARFGPYLRNVEKDVTLYREENVPLQAEIGVLAQQYGVISGAMTVEIDGKEYTLQQAARFLQNPDRDLRERTFRAISSRRLQDTEKLDHLFDRLLQLRHRVAQNAGFDNYRDYKFRELGRFDYGPEDCFLFHDAVREHILPLQALLIKARQERLGLEVMRPWDADAEPADRKPLHPFETGNELAGKAEDVFARLRPFYAQCLETMDAKGRLDLESRKGKAPGGYNCPLPETGVPFIFMNAAGTMGDVITMMHEGGHAIHSFLSHKLALSAFKEYPMEIAEVASMSMELFSMEHWDVFFPNPEELRRARLDELERVITVLPWIATIDKFQHWLYTHPGHSVPEREAAWRGILGEFSVGITDWSGFEDSRGRLWQKQLHLFEVPFYYIEYGIAQLGAIAMWRQFRGDREGTLDRYEAALALGYTKPLPELYRTAGIKFDFSPAYVQELGAFVRDALGDMGVA